MKRRARIPFRVRCTLTLTLVALCAALIYGAPHS